ncbi:MAG: YerC/YecD family TrpR-related protein [Oscillospiraceae bacterium]|nr:YerC/YecD family TrpR-related protein [Ruminococcus sp.]MDY3087939.1 YerC/YecD family TrpR-related protein [Oscillospiraceae bacterium]
MCNWHNDSTDELCEAILSLKTREECYAFLEDICTIKELLEMSQRLSVAKLLSRGMSYSQISQKTGVSTATISRISRCIEYGSGGYKMIIERLQEGEKND